MASLEEFTVLLANAMIDQHIGLEEREEPMSYRRRISHDWGKKGETWESCCDH
jgi:hypothetical protein